MKIKKMFVWLIAICVFGFGMAYADVNNPQIFIPVEAVIVEPGITVTLNADGLNFGQILPDREDARWAEIDVHLITKSQNAGDAQTKADNAQVDDTSAVMSSHIPDPSVVLLSATTRTAGGFTLVSDTAASITVLFDDTLILTSDAPVSPGTMTVTDIYDSSNHNGDTATLTPITLLGGVTQHIHIGGVLNIGANQAGGTYTNLDGGLQVDIALQ